jgi:glycosyltransferase involved in cell wall biosynthesis
MTPPLVSVIIPFHETPPTFLEEAIESVRAQTYPHWELILVNDGARAGAVNLARSYGAAFPGSIRVVQHLGGGNCGISASRNLGLAHARGEYVAFLDADDVWLADKLAQQTALLTPHPTVGLSYGRTLYWHSWTGREEDRARDYIPELGVPAGSLVQPPGLLPLFLDGRAAVPCICSVLARRDVAAATGGFEAAFPGLYEDQVFYAKMCLAASVLVGDSVWDRYRQHPESVTSRAARGEARRSRLRYLDWLEGYLARHGSGHDSVRRALESERWKVRHPRLARVARSLRRLERRLGR